MRLRRLSAGLVVLAVLLALPAGAAKPIAHREVLPNGIVLLVAERPAVPIIVVRTFAHAGAVLDPPARAGLANLTGAVLTRGTPKATAPARRRGALSRRDRPARHDHHHRGRCHHRRRRAPRGAGALRRLEGHGGGAGERAAGRRGRAIAERDDREGPHPGDDHPRSSGH